jgi:hypothetical protein
MIGYDYIIAGAGTAGCVLAAGLTQDPGIRVLLLEAGEPVLTPALTVPDAWPGLIGGAARTPAAWSPGYTSSAAGAPGSATCDVGYRRGRPEEVIVCAGAVGSPQLLMLSGIGPASRLQALSIDPVADLPGTAANLQDPPGHHGLLYRCRRAGATTGRPTRRCAARWRAPGLTCSCSRSCSRSGPPGTRGRCDGFALGVAAVAPDSRGTVRLAAADPLAAALIDPGLLCDGRVCAMWREENRPDRLSAASYGAPPPHVAQHIHYLQATT